MVAAYSTRVEPCKYTCMLIFGIIAAILSFVIMAHIVFYIVLDMTPGLDYVLDWVNNTRLTFFSTIIISVLYFYFVICTIKGNITFGLRFVVVSFYPIVPRETFITSFMANCAIMNLWMFALAMFNIIMFSGFLVETDAAKIFLVQVQYF
jgi:hypothetical protein